MKRKWERDLGLQGRMLFTMFLLAVVYLFFLAFLTYYGTPPVFMILFIGLFMGIQYFYSDKLVLWTIGAHVVSESEAPQLHGMITRLCAIADLPKPQVAIVNSGPKCLCNRPEPRIKLLLQLRQGLWTNSLQPNLRQCLPTN